MNAGDLLIRQTNQTVRSVTGSDVTRAESLFVGHICTDEASAGTEEWLMSDDTSGSGSHVLIVNLQRSKVNDQFQGPIMLAT
jgi:hypothetical protein